MLVAQCEIGRSDLRLGAVCLHLLGISGGTVEIAVDRTSQPGETTDAISSGSEKAESCCLPIDHRPKPSLPGSAKDVASTARFRWSYVPRLMLGQIAASLAAVVHRW
jgi:hypothetical protein